MRHVTLLPFAAIFLAGCSLGNPAERVRYDDGVYSHRAYPAAVIVSVENNDSEYDDNGSYPENDVRTVTPTSGTRYASRTRARTRTYIGGGFTPHSALGYSSYGYGTTVYNTYIYGAHGGWNTYPMWNYGRTNRFGYFSCTPYSAWNGPGFPWWGWNQPGGNWGWDSPYGVWGSSCSGWGSPYAGWGSPFGFNDPWGWNAPYGWGSPFGWGNPYAWYGYPGYPFGNIGFNGGMIGNGNGSNGGGNTGGGNTGGGPGNGGGSPVEPERLPARLVLGGEVPVRTPLTPVGRPGRIQDVGETTSNERSPASGTSEEPLANVGKPSRGSSSESTWNGPSPTSSDKGKRSVSDWDDAPVRGNASPAAGKPRVVPAPERPKSSTVAPERSGPTYAPERTETPRYSPSRAGESPSAPQRSTPSGTPPPRSAAPSPAPPRSASPSYSPPRSASPSPAPVRSASPSPAPARSAAPSPAPARGSNSGGTTNRSTSPSSNGRGGMNATEQP